MRDFSRVRRRLLNFERLTGIPAFDALASFRRRSPTDLNVLRAMRAAIVWRGKSRRAFLDQLAKYALWPIFPVSVAASVWKYGRAAKAVYGRGYGGQALDLVRLGFANGVPPRQYYDGGLALLRGRELDRFIPIDLYSSVAFGLARFHDHGSLALQLDKLAFEKECRRHGLPVVETLAVIDEDTASRPDGGDLAELPHEDLIVKPSQGSQGRGVALFRAAGPGQFVDSESTTVTGAELIADLQSRAQRAGIPYLIQRRALNSPALAGLVLSALSTVRVVTVLDETGQPEIVDAFFRTPVNATAAVDNFHAGGSWFPIDLKTGVLKAGFGAGYERRPVNETHHPVTGAEVAGRLHPGALASFELALRAHRAFPDLFISGWDIGFGADGPVIVEFNVPPGVDAGTQRVCGGFIGSRFGRLFAFHATRWLAANVERGSRWAFADAVPGPALPVQTGAPEAAAPVNRR